MNDLSWLTGSARTLPSETMAAPKGIRKNVLGLLRLIRATSFGLSHWARLGRLKQLGRQWAFTYESSKICESYLYELWPGIEDITANVRLGLDYTYDLPYGERAIVSGLVKHLKPMLIFEFGTFLGTTSTILADAAPTDGMVHTIDLPDEYFPKAGLDGWFTSEMVGRMFVGRPEYDDRVVLHRCDIAEFDFSEFSNSVDFVLIDAGHSFEDVLRDSRIGMEMLAPGGTIVWDDYQAAQWESVRALNALATRVRMVRIAGTRLVVHTAAC